MRLKELQSVMQDVKPFGSPKVELEQYVTGPELASRLLYTIDTVYGELAGHMVADFGCGTGMLAIGAALLGSRHVVAIDVDADALDAARDNIEEYEDLPVDLVQADVSALPRLLRVPVDTVVMNPPFGTRRKGADLVFLRAAFKVCTGAVYSLHKSATREHLARMAGRELGGAPAAVLAELRYDLPASYVFHRYDTRTTIFSPEGRLYQVEYAMEAISNAGAAIGVLATDGVVLAAEKKITSKLLDTNAVGVRREKMYKLDDHVACAVAGITADANILINQCRVAAQRHFFTYQEAMPVEQLVRTVCDNKQGYTQFGGLRPFGVSLLYAGWDEVRDFQLYQSDPSGNYGGWKATAIGANKQGAQNLLKQDYKDTLTTQEGVRLVIKVLSKTMDSTTLTPEKVELATVTRDAETGRVMYHVYEDRELRPLLDAVNQETAKEKEEGA